MTTNKQSEKREAPIMVIEGKTLKTLIKKENKMEIQPNYSLNKTIKSLKNSKKYPEYKLEKNSLLSVKLPNGMNLLIASDDTGEYCSMSVTNFINRGSFLRNRGEFETEVIEEDKEINHENAGDYDFKSTTIRHDNYSSYYNNKANIKSSFRVELREYRN
jgi:hypothetical protein